MKRYPFFAENEMIYYNGSAMNESDIMNKSKKWWLGFLCFLILFFWGADKEFNGMILEKISPASETVARYQMMLFCFVLLLIYFVPFVIFMRYTCRKLEISRRLPVIAFFSGWFIPGWVAGQLNEAAGKLIRALTSRQFTDTWGDAIEAPLIEETLKVLVVVWFLCLIGRKLRKHYLVAGMCVGMGFQISEDLSYIEEQVSGSHADYASAISFTLTDRVAGGLVSHWCYTGLMAVAVYLIFIAKKRRNGILLLVAVLLSHGLWDSPLSDTDFGTGVLSAGLFIIFVYVYAKTVKEAIAKDAVDKASGQK